MLVQKFGGGILANRQDFERAAAIIQQRKPEVVVVSAMQGVTDQLINLIQLASNKKPFSIQLWGIKKMHLGLAKNKVNEIESILTKLEKLLQGISCTGEYSDKLYAQIVSRGEYLSALVMQSYLSSYSFWPAENGIAAQGDYLNARCNFSATKKPPAYSIVTGFYGINKAGEICLFGRGGSDYTAGAVAKIIGAEKVEFWKNVDGFMTTDPKIATKALMINQLSFEEAAELCRFGAKILHPSALEPLLNTKTHVEIKNVLKPEANGTTIGQKTTRNEIAAITGRKSIAAISVSGNELVEGFGIAAKILTNVAEAKVPIDVIATAQANVSFTVEEQNSNAAVQSLVGLQQFEVTTKQKLALIGIVGNGIKGNPAIISKIFAALARQGIQIEMISQGASEIDLSIIVNQGDYEKAIQSIHNTFFGEN